MKKNCFIVVVCILIISSLSACGREKENGLAQGEAEEAVTEKIREDDIQTGGENNHLVLDVIDNMKIEAEVENSELRKASKYQTGLRGFDKEAIKSKFFKDKLDFDTIENENGTVTMIDNKTKLLIQDTGVIFTQDDTMWDLLNIIGSVYSLELDYSSINRDKLKEIEQGETVSSVKEILSEICQLKEDEELYLDAGTNVESNKILQEQNKWKSEGKGTFDEIDDKWNWKDCYYLSFNIAKNGIPLTSFNEPSVIVTDENLNVQLTQIQVIVNEEGIQLLNISGIFGLEKQNEEELISVDEAVQKIKEEYELQILTSECVVDKIWLEYLFVADQSTQDFTKGTLEPYWCFQIKTTEEGEEGEDIIYSAERINGITGENFKYE